MSEMQTQAEPTDATAPAEPLPADPYGGVALGVECAWPAEFQL